MKLLRFILLMAGLLAVIFSCQHTFEPKHVELEPLKIPEPFDGQLTVSIEGREYHLYLFANPNGYQEGELVLRGSAAEWDRTLMLTFQLAPKGRVAINQQMTGYWDLGLCIPFRRYLLDTGYPNRVEIESYDKNSGELRGIFNLRVKNEEAPFDKIEFTNGRFRTNINPFAFEYCIEG